MVQTSKRFFRIDEWFDPPDGIIKYRMVQTPFSSECLETLDYVLISNFGLTIGLAILTIVMNMNGRLNRIFDQSHYAGRSAVFAPPPNAIRPSG